MQNEPGALTRLTCLFSTRGYNIESLNVAPTEDAGISRLTVTTTGSDAAIDQIAKQIAKQIDVIDMYDMTLGDHFEREIALVKLSRRVPDIAAVQRFCNEHGASILDDSPASFTMELASSTAAVDRFIQGLESFCEIVALVRSGAVGISRGATVMEGEVTPAVALRDEAAG